jgi:SAM-dependent methyltransferase
MLEDRRRV